MSAGIRLRVLIAVFIMIAGIGFWAGAYKRPMTGSFCMPSDCEATLRRWEKERVDETKLAAGMILLSGGLGMIVIQYRRATSVSGGRTVGG